MKQKNLIIGGLVLLAVIGGVIAMANQSSNKESDGAGAHQTQSGASSSTSQTTTTTAVDSTNKQVVEVDIEDYAYNPKTIKIKKGTKVTWTNKDVARHDVVSDADSSAKGLESPLISKGESWSYTFDSVGTYNYHCSPHPYMKASVEVVE